MRILVCYTNAILHAACYFGNWNMTGKKTAALNLRIDPDIKEAVRIAAKIEHRSIANMVEYLILQHCEKVNITIPKQETLFVDSPGE